MIIKVKLIIQELEYIPEMIDESDPTNTLKEHFKNLKIEVEPCALNTKDIRYWFFNNSNVKVCLKDGSVIMLKHSLEEFEDILRSTLGNKTELLSSFDRDILEYLVRNNDYGLQNNMFKS